MAQLLNPKHRQVVNAAVKGSESIVEILEEGRAGRIMGEMSTFNINEVTVNMDVPVAGGGIGQQTRLTRYEGTATFVVGTDGGYWEELIYDMRRGYIRHLTFITTTEDPATVRLNGGRVSSYSNVEVLTLTDMEQTDGGATGPKLAQITFWADVGAKTIIRQYLPVQEV